MADYQFNTQLGPAQQQGTNIADMIKLAGGIQSYQQAQQLNPLQLQKAQMDIEQAQKLNPLAVRQQEAQTGSAELGLSEKQTSALYGLAGGVLNDPRIQKGNKEEVLKALKEAEDRSSTFNIPKNVVNGVFAPLHSYAEQNPGSVKQVLSNLIQSGIGAAGQQTLQTPGIVQNAAGQLVAVTPVANKIRVVGDNTQAGGVPETPNPTQAQAGLLNAATTAAGADWAQTQQDANTAQGRIAIFQNIKRLTPEAFTGVGGERKKFLSGLAQSIGIPVEELATSSTDELVKNSKLLALAGGNTDAARSIAELATPNAKMTKEAILRVADQLIGIEKLKEAKANWLAPYLSNPAEYVRKQQEFNKYSDFRLFQEMTPDEVAKLKASMSPAEQQNMSRKIKEARTLGIIR